jgi:hypothetical protein
MNNPISSIFLSMTWVYDMQADPGERHNLQGEHRDRVKELVALLKKQVADGRSTGLTSNGCYLELSHVETIPFLSK